MDNKKMDHATFKKLCDELLEYCQDKLLNKNAEYATCGDKLHNFRQPTSMMGCSAAETCFWYDLKHISSLAKIAKECSDGKLPTKELLREKVGDYLNYGMLLYAIVVEMIDSQEQDGAVPIPVRVTK